MAGGTVPTPTPETATFWEGTLAGELRMNLDVGGASPVVFRYTVTKTTD